MHYPRDALNVHRFVKISSDSLLQCKSLSHSLVHLSFLTHIYDLINSCNKETIRKITCFLMLKNNMIRAPCPVKPDVFPVLGQREAATSNTFAFAG